MRLKQTATYERDRRWKWSIEVEGDEEALKQIEYVEYSLHPSFAQPVRQIEDRKSNFRLDSSGWGEFKIRAQVVNKDGSSRKLSHWLELEFPAAGQGQAQDAATAKGIKEEEHPVLFLSCTVADALFANALAKVLISQGVRILMVADEPADLSLEASVNQLLDQANVAVFIFSDEVSTWMKREVEAAIEHKIPIIPLIMMSGEVKNSKLPSEMKEAILIEPVAPEKYDEEARDVATRLRKHIETRLPGLFKEEKDRAKPKSTRAE